MLGITDFRDKLVRELSTGSRRIVDLACILAHGPRCLLLDEPSSGIAQREAEALGPLLLRIRERTGATLLVIEHDVPLLLGIADRIVALDLGEVVAEGPPDEVVHDTGSCSRTRHRRYRDRAERKRSTILNEPLDESRGNRMQPTTPRKTAIAARALRTVHRDHRGDRDRRHRLGGEQQRQDKKTAVTPAAVPATPAERRPDPVPSRAEGGHGREVHVAGPLRPDDRSRRDADPLPGSVRAQVRRHNGGATEAPAVTADTIRIGYYIAKPDPVSDGLLKATGAYDPPAKIEADGTRSYVQLFASQYQLSGRKIQLVKIQGTGASRRRGRGQGRRRQGRQTAARVRGHRRSRRRRRASRRARGEQGALRRDVLDLRPAAVHPGTLAVHLADGSVARADEPDGGRRSSRISSPASPPSTPATRRSGPRPARSRCSATTPRTAGSRRHGTTWSQRLKDAGVTLKLHKTYFLDFNALTQNAHDIAVALKQANATSVIFTGDPLMPSYFTKEATAQNYHPEWIMAGTVLADTSVFGRVVRPEPVGARVRARPHTRRVPCSRRTRVHGPPVVLRDQATERQELRDHVRRREAAVRRPPVGGSEAHARELQGGHRTRSRRPPTRTATVQAFATYGDHGFWNGDDPSGLDNAGLLWWNPNGRGADETGIVGNGMYELVDGGKRYPAGKWPTTPVKLFDPTGAVTLYNNLPPDLTPKYVPVAGRLARGRRPYPTADSVTCSRGTVTQPSPATYRRTTRAGTPATTE